MADSTYDFIIVGSGPAGASIAWRLANSKKAPSVLVLESGGDNSNKDWRVSGDRYVSRFNPVLNYSYKTVPQKNLENRELDYDRGRGLGGSSSINFCVWQIGPKGDHDEIARLTGDDAWKWDNAKERYKRVEHYHLFAPEIPPDVDRWLNPKRENHGFSGPIHVGVPNVWESTLIEQIHAFASDPAFPLRPDLGDGAGIGLTICPNTVYKGVRTSAASMIDNGPSNLHIKTNSTVHKVVFEGKRATGIVTLDGKTYHARKEVVIAAGALDTPKILMHSGIGPADQLSAFNLPVLHENPAVGQNLVDHSHILPAWERREPPEVTARLSWIRASPEERQAALEQWKRDQTGPLTDILTTNAIGTFKLPAVLNSKEFAELPEEQKRFLSQPTVPSYEIILDGPALDFFVNPTGPPLAGFGVFVYNQQARGSVTLQSADPTVPMLYDPNVFGHPYDRRVAVEATRELLRMIRSPAFAKDTLGPSAVSGAPSSDSEEDILAYWRKNTMSTWHMSGTCKIGKDEKADHAVVDPQFRVFGVEKLRVADMSVIPIIVNNHTQTTAYLTGLTCGDKLVDEYGLDA